MAVCCRCRHADGRAVGAVLFGGAREERQQEDGGVGELGRGAAAVRHRLPLPARLDLERHVGSGIHLHIKYG